jgi:hypothetical protein
MSKTKEENPQRFHIEIWNHEGTPIDLEDINSAAKAFKSLFEAIWSIKNPNIPCPEIKIRLENVLTSSFTEMIIKRIEALEKKANLQESDDRK